MDERVEEVLVVDQVIDLPRDETWQLLVDWSRAPQWMTGVDSLQADGPVAAGTELTLRANGRERPAFLVEVEELEVLVIRSRTRGTTTDYRYELRDHDGGTRVTLRAAVSTSGLHRLFGPVLHDAIRRTDSGQLVAFKRLAEQLGQQEELD